MGKNEVKDDAAPIAPPAQLLTVAELAQKHGQTFAPISSEDAPFSATHLHADALHGWTRHKAYKSEDVRLSDADYLAALAATKIGQNGSPYAPANMRPLTTFTKEQAEAKLAQDKAAPKSAPQRGAYNPNHGHQQTMHKARALAQSSGVKLKGGR